MVILQYSPKILHCVQDDKQEAGLTAVSILWSIKSKDTSLLFYVLSLSQSIFKRRVKNNIVT
jgi:hypothetical protein